MRCIYAILNKVNGKTYVGKHKYQNTEDLLGNYWGSGRLIKKAISKYGKENFKRFILRRNIRDNHMANLYEIAFIRVFKQYGMCEYNISKGGDGGYLGVGPWNKGIHLSEEHKRNIRESCKGGNKASFRKGHIPWNKGRRAEQISKGLMGHKVSEETKKKISKANKGKHIGSRNSQFGTHWYTNGEINIKAKECPDSFKPGKVVHKGE